MPNGWEVQGSMDKAVSWPMGGSYYGATLSNNTVVIGNTLYLTILCMNTVSEASGYFRGLGPPADFNKSDPLIALGDSCKVWYTTSTVQDSNGTHLKDAYTGYLIRIGNVIVEVQFVTAGPFAIEQKFREMWMDELVSMQVEKVQKVGLLFH
jgi:hypothetical protein